jgi:HD-like signal output (HDOD) protein
MNVPTLEQLLNKVPRSLGSYAPVLDEIESVLESPQCSLASVGEAIEKDPDLTAQLLKLGNSAFYGFSARLSTVAEAVSLIGIQQVQDLILASSIIDQFSGLPPEQLNMESFWRHSLACGTCARILALENRLPKADKFFVGGLLHDIGRLVLVIQAPETSKEVFARYQTGGMLLHQAESQVLGYTSRDIGRALLQRWKYPEFLVQAVAGQPGANGAGRTEIAVVHFSDYLVNAMAIGCSGERQIAPLRKSTWEILGLNETALDTLMGTLDRQMEAVEEVFLGN